jgi:hypothetical protein
MDHPSHQLPCAPATWVRVSARKAEVGFLHARPEPAWPPGVGTLDGFVSPLTDEERPMTRRNSDDGIEAKLAELQATVTDMRDMIEEMHNQLVTEPDPDVVVSCLVAEDGHVVGHSRRPQLGDHHLMTRPFHHSRGVVVTGDGSGVRGLR